MRDFGRKLEAAKRASTAQLLFKCARLLNERAIATLPVADETRPRAAHMALFPHVDLEHGTRLTTLADKLGVSKQAVAQLVDDLEAMGVMARVPDPDDGRAKRVVFTDKGRAAMLDGLAHLRDIEKDLTRAVGRETMASLHQALLALHDHLTA